MKYHNTEGIAVIVYRRLYTARKLLPIYAMPLHKITADQIQALYNSYAGSLSSASIYKIHKLLNAAFKKAVITKKIIYNPMVAVEPPKVTQEEITIFSFTELLRLFRVMKRSKRWQRYYTFYYLLLVTGMRIGEICALRWENIDLEKRVLTVRHTIQRIQCFEGDRKTKVIIAEPKSQSSRREIPIPDCIMPMLKELKGKNSAFVLTETEKPIEPRTMQYRFKRILENAGVGYYNFHVLRHSMASSAVELGFDVKTLSEILGHSSVQVTLDRYIHTSMEHKRNCMNLMTIAS